jgi:apolipoprotein N-acyltransferase
LTNSRPSRIGKLDRRNFRVRACTHLSTHAFTYLLLIVSGLLLTVIQPPIDWSFFAWVAFVPFALACSPRVGARGLAFAAFLVGYVYWLGNLYWIQPITVLGWLGMGLYLSPFWVLPALGVRLARVKGLPLFVVLPILVAGFERLQGFPLGGFFWRFLGHSQYANLAVIQVADLVGAAGVSFVVAMVNGLLAELIVKRGPSSDASRFTLHVSRSLLLGGMLTAAVVAGTVLYGQWRLRQTPEYVTDGPLVGSLQSNVPQSVKRSYTAGGQLFDDLMKDSKAAAAAGAELIVWPETMVQGMLEPALWPYLSGNLEEDKAFHRRLCEHAKDTACLLVGAHGADIKWDRLGEPYLATYNSAYFYHLDGTRDPGRYDKIHLVLFGEYIPLKRWFPLFERLMPEGYRPSLTLEHGRNYTIFEMDRSPRDPNSPAAAPHEQQSPYRFAVIICYEGTIPYVPRNFTLDDQGRKRIDWLVNISNDGWFVRFPEGQGRVIPSSELPQHAAICAFRAVENRLAVIRSVNTGISCLIDSTGRIRDGYLAASDDFPAEAMKRTAIAGWFLDRLPIDSRVTFYSRHGEWFANSCAVVALGMVVWPLGTRWRRRRQGSGISKAA